MRKVGSLTLVILVHPYENRCKSLTEQELNDIMLEFRTNVILWGSPKVINVYLDFQNASNLNENILLIVDELHKAIREDIGLSNQGLNKKQLVKMYLKDPSELDLISNSKQQVLADKQQTPTIQHLK